MQTVRQEQEGKNLAICLWKEAQLLNHLAKSHYIEKCSNCDGKDSSCDCYVTHAPQDTRPNTTPVETYTQGDAKDSILAKTPEQASRGLRDRAEYLGESPSPETRYNHSSRWINSKLGQAWLRILNERRAG